jgi:hypothetical protein
MPPSGRAVSMPPGTFPSSAPHLDTRNPAGKIPPLRLVLCSCFPDQIRRSQRNEAGGRRVARGCQSRRAPFLRLLWLIFGNKVTHESYLAEKFTNCLDVGWPYKLVLQT